MAHAEDRMVDTSPNATLEAQQRLYKGMMDFTMTVGLPVGGAIAMLVAVLLLDAGIFVSIFVSFLTWLLLLAFAKKFLVH